MGAEPQLGYLFLNLHAEDCSCLCFLSKLVTESVVQQVGRSPKFSDVRSLFFFLFGLSSHYFPEKLTLEFQTFFYCWKQGLPYTIEIWPFFYQEVQE